MEQVNNVAVFDADSFLEELFSFKNHNIHQPLEDEVDGEDSDSFSSITGSYFLEESSDEEDDPVDSYSRNKIMRLRGTTESSSFLPLFFCPQAFRQCAIRTASTAMRAVQRIGPEVTRRSVSLEGPLAILDWCDDPEKQVAGCPSEALISLSRFYHNDCRWMPFFNETYSVRLKLRPDFDAFDHSLVVSCPMCEFPISSIIALIDHVTSTMHRNKVKGFDTSVDREALSFWQNAIDRSFEGPPCRCQEKPLFDTTDSERRRRVEKEIASLVVTTEQPREERADEIEIARPLSREEVIQVSDVVGSSMFFKLAETRDIFRPRFFCPRAFRLVAWLDCTALHEMNRVCDTSLDTDASPVALNGPLAILDRCDNSVGKMEDVSTAMKRLSRFRRCDRVKLIVAMSQMERKLRINYDEFDHSSPISCALCHVSLYSHWNLLCHITSTQHIAKAQAVGSSVDINAFHCWNAVIKRTFIYRAPAIECVYLDLKIDEHFHPKVDWTVLIDALKEAELANETQPKTRVHFLDLPTSVPPKPKKFVPSRAKVVDSINILPTDSAGSWPRAMVPRGHPKKVPDQRISLRDKPKKVRMPDQRISLRDKPKETVTVPDTAGS